MCIRGYLFWPFARHLALRNPRERDTQTVIFSLRASVVPFSCRLSVLFYLNLAACVHHRQCEYRMGFRGLDAKAWMMWPFPALPAVRGGL